MKCSHDIQGHDRILWYRQSHDEELTLMGYLVSEFQTIENKFKGKIIISGKANEYYSSLNMTTVTPESGGVYFCAAYSTTVQIPFLHYKNQYQFTPSPLRATLTTTPECVFSSEKVGNINIVYQADYCSIIQQSILTCKTVTRKTAVC